MLQTLLSSFDMFIFLFLELSILFLLISYIVSILQDFFPPERIQQVLGQGGKGYVAAALLGAITPFCSCSTIPFLKGLIRAGVGVGSVLVFLFSSPLLNPIIIVLFAATFGLKVTVFYFVTAMGISITAGFILEKLGFEKYIKDQANTEQQTSCCTAQIEESSCCSTESKEQEASTTSCCAIEPTKQEIPTTSCRTVESKEQEASCCGTPKPESLVSKIQWKKAWDEAWKSFKDVFWYLLAGVTIGAFIYGFLPAEMIAKIANDENIFAIPVAAIIGIPLYVRAEVVIPLSAALVAKGMSLGAVMALIIGSAGASLTELILLKSIFKNQLIIAFLIVVLCTAMGAGYLYNVIF